MLMCFAGLGSVSGVRWFKSSRHKERQQFSTIKSASSLCRIAWLTHLSASSVFPFHNYSLEKLVWENDRFILSAKPVFRIFEGKCNCLQALKSQQYFKCYFLAIAVSCLFSHYKLRKKSWCQPLCLCTYGGKRFPCPQLVLPRSGRLLGGSFASWFMI